MIFSHRNIYGKQTGPLDFKLFQDFALLEGSCLSKVGGKLAFMF